jgi:hypothetical protein
MPFVAFTGELDTPEQPFVPFTGELDQAQPGANEAVGYDALGNQTGSPLADSGPGGRIADEAANLRDTFFSGVDQTIASGKTLNLTAQLTSLNVARDKLRGMEASGLGTSPEAEGLRKTIAHYETRVPSMAGSMAESQADAARGQAITQRPAVAELMKAKTFGDAWEAFKKSPYDVIAGVSAASLPSTIPALVAAAVMGPAGGAAAMGLNSATVEAGNSLADYAHDNGVDTTNADAVRTFFENRENLAAAMEYAGKRAGIIGALDAASGGIASKTIAPKALRPIVRQAINVPAQMGVQAAMGAGGEAGAQLATKGRIDEPGQVLAEAAGEMGGAPAEVAAFSTEARHALRPAVAPETARINQVLAAPNLESAIAAAEHAANPEPAGSIRTQLPNVQEHANVSDSVGAAGEPAASERAGDTVNAGSVGDRGLLSVDTGRGDESTPALPATGSEQAVAVGDAGQRSPAVAATIAASPEVADLTRRIAELESQQAAQPVAAPQTRKVAEPSQLATPAIAATETPSGTIALSGDVQAIRARLQEFGISNAIPVRGGMLIGRSQAEHARAVLIEAGIPVQSDPASTPQAAAAAPTAVRIEPPVRAMPGKVEGPRELAQAPLFRSDPTPEDLFRQRAGSAAAQVRAPRGITREQFSTELGKGFGNDIARSLLRKRVIEPVEDESKVPAHVVPFLREGKKVFGFYDPRTDRTYAVLGNLRPGMARGLALHEVGVHYGFREMLGPQKYAQVIERIKVMGRAGNATVREALRLAQENAAAAHQVPEETLAYLVQHHGDLGVVREVIARIKAFLYQRLGVGGKNLTVDDIAMLAQGAVRHAAKQEPATRVRVAEGDTKLSSEKEPGPPALNQEVVRRGVRAMGAMEPVKVRGLGDRPLSSLRESAKLAYQRAATMGPVTMSDGRSVKLTSVGLKETRMHSADRRVLDILGSIRSVLEGSHYLGTLEHEKTKPGDSIRAWHYYGAKVNLDGKELYAKLVVREDVNGNIYYDNDLSSIEDLGGVDGRDVDAGPAKPGAASVSADKRTLADFVRMSGEQLRPEDGGSGTPRTPGEPPNFSRDEELKAWDVAEPTRTDKVIYELQDGRIDLKRTQQAIKEAGREIEERFDARLAETLYPGRVAYQTQQFLEAEAKPLLQHMAANQVTIDELSDYLLARHAPERNAQIAKVNPKLQDGGAGKNSRGELMTTEAANRYIADIPKTRRETLDAVAKRVDAITAGTRKLLVDEGLEKPATVRAWQDAYQFYAPLFKDEAQAGAPHPIGTGFSVRGTSSKRATGSTKQVTDVLGHVLMQREAAITRAEKNRVGLSLYGLVLSHPNPEFWATIKPSMKQDEILHELRQMGVPEEQIAGMEPVPTVRTVDEQTNQVVERPNPLYKSLPGAITVKLAGEDRVIMLNVKNERAARLAETLKNLDGLTQLDLANSIIGKATRWIASVNTQYNPVFGFMNVVRDIQHATLNTSTTPIANKRAQILGDIPAAVVGIARDLRDDAHRTEWSDLWREFQDAGGRTGYRELFRDAADRTKAIASELEKLESEGRLTPGRAAHAVLELLDDFNSALENGTRLAAYKAARDIGQSKAEAARIARELTVDFNRKGRAGRELGPLYAFFNASMQGSARTIETLKGPAGAKIIAGGIALGVIQALMLAAAGYDEDDMQDFTKARNLIIPTAWRSDRKTYIAIPLAQGMSILPNTGRVLTELALSGGKHLGKKIGGALAELVGSFNPLGNENPASLQGALKMAAPTVIDPVIEVATNRNFAGSQIERKPFNEEGDNRPGFTRARETTQRSATGQVYIGASKAINALTGGTPYEAGAASPTPEAIRYLAQTAGGGVLREFEKSLNAISNVAKGEPVKMGAIPLTGRFFGEVDQDAVTQSRYFDAKSKILKLESSLRAAQKAGDKEAVARIMRDNPEVNYYDSVVQVQRSISELNRAAVATVDNPDRTHKIDETRVKNMRQLTDALKKLEAREPTPSDKLRAMMD